MVLKSFSDPLRLGKKTKNRTTKTLWLTYTPICTFQWGKKNAVTTITYIAQEDL